MERGQDYTTLGSCSRDGHAECSELTADAALMCRPCAGLVEASPAGPRYCPFRSPGDCDLSAGCYGPCRARFPGRVMIVG